MLLAAMFGQLVHVYQDASNQAAVLYCAAVETAWLAAVVTGVGMYHRYEWAADSSPHRFVIGLVLLLITSAKCVYDMIKEHRITLFSKACLNASCSLVESYVWPLELQLFSFLVEGLVGNWVVCWYQLGKHPMQVAQQVGQQDVQLESVVGD
jgi:hypothetical protein